MPNSPIATGMKSTPSIRSVHAEREAQRAGVLIGADGGQQQPDQHHADRFEGRAARQHDDGDQAEGHEREIFGRAEGDARPWQAAGRRRR